MGIGGKMLGNYIFGSHAVLLAYDITNADSFHNLEDWLAVVNNVFDNEEQKPYLGLIGNNMASFFVSAKTGDHVSQSFFRVAADLSGVVLTKSELEAELKVVDAEVVDYPQNEIAAQMPTTKSQCTEDEDSGCTLQ